MPVTGTPIPPAVTTTVGTPCNAKTLKTTEVYGHPVLSKAQAIQADQGESFTLVFHFKDEEGNAVNLTPCVTQAKMRIREALMKGDATEVTGTITDSANGICTFAMPAAAMEYAGVSICDVAGLDGSNVVKLVNKFYLITNRGQWGPEVSKNGPPTVSEIRMQLKDSAPEDNYLLDENEFDLAEIAFSIIRPIEQFNNMQPPVEVSYNTATFPYRQPWLEGIISNLLMIAAAHYRRNQLAYSAAGISVDDKNKEPQYLQAAAFHKQNWEQFAKAKKVELNMEAGFGNLYSDYSYGGYNPYH